MESGAAGGRRDGSARCVEEVQGGRGEVSAAGGESYTVIYILYSRGGYYISRAAFCKGGKTVDRLTLYIWAAFRSWIGTMARLVRPPLSYSFESGCHVSRLLSRARLTFFLSSRRR